jgi:hypothetical protein
LGKNYPSLGKNYHSLGKNYHSEAINLSREAKFYPSCLNHDLLDSRINHEYASIYAFNQENLIIMRIKVQTKRNSQPKQGVHYGYK